MEKEPINSVIQVTKHSTSLFKLNDIGFRVILIPFFGIAIPLLTRMINFGNFSNWQVKLSFLYTIFLAFIIWQGNRYLLFTLRSYFNWFNKPLKKIVTLLVAISFYTIPLSVILLVGWYHIFSNGIIDWDTVFTSTLIIMVCVIFITHVYETVFLVKDTESEMVRNEQLQKAKALAELEALKNQIDPHFIFNSLNTLSHLIEEKPEKAKLFNDTLADVYRYNLQNKGKDLVMLEDEIIFLQNYFSLLKIRFEDAVKLSIPINNVVANQSLIPPGSLQTLVENAIKHNEFSDDQPLEITIILEEEMLMIQNKIHKKNIQKPSSGIGLINLKERYKLITSKEIIIRQTSDDFTVWMPVLKMY